MPYWNPIIGTLKRLEMFFTGQKRSYDEEAINH